MKVACVLITHLPIKAELRKRPALQGRPVIIAESSGSKQSVLDSSPEAVGVVAGMSLQEALSRCKDAELLQVDEPYYRAAFDNLVGSLEQRSPLVEKAELGCAYVGLDGLEEMYGGEPRLITSLLQAVPREFNPRIGVAPGKFPAYIMAVTSGGGQANKMPSAAAEFLQDLSVDLLPVSWDSKSRLRRFGLHTLGQLAGLAVGAVQAQFGVEGRRIWELAQGIDPSPILPNRREDLIIESLTFPSPAITRQAIVTAAETLLGRAFSRPEIRGRHVRGTVIQGRVFRHPPWVRQFAFKDAVRNKDRAFFVIKNALESVTLPGPLEDLELTLIGFAGESGIQTSLFSDVRKLDQLREMMRQLEVQLGEKPPIYQVRDIEPWSRIPERRQVLVPFDP